MVGNERDVAILGSLAWAGVLSTAQLQHLHFVARRRAQRRLRTLFDHGLVRAHLQGGALERENVYTLSPQGLDLLVEHGAFPDGPPPLARAPASGKLRHTLLVRDVFVALHRAHQDGALALDDFRFDGDLAREPDLKARGIIPDGLALVRVAGRPERWAIEVDAGTETTTVLRAKFDKYARAFASGVGLFASLSLVVLAPREGRLRTLAAVVEGAGLRDRTRVMLLDELGPSLRHTALRAAMHEPAAPTEQRVAVVAPSIIADGETFRPRRHRLG